MNTGKILGTIAIISIGIYAYSQYKKYRNQQQSQIIVKTGK